MDGGVGGTGGSGRMAAIEVDRWRWQCGGWVTAINYLPATRFSFIYGGGGDVCVHSPENLKLNIFQTISQANDGM